MRDEWLASGGAYWILGVAWLLGAIGFVASSLRHGSARGEEADGCALALGTFVTMSVAGGIGLRLAPYPWFLLTAIGLGLLAPGALIALTRRRDRRP